MTRDLAALMLVTVVAITGITVLMVWPEAPRHPNEQVALQSAAVTPSSSPQPSSASSAEVKLNLPPDAATRSALTATAARGVTVSVSVLGTGGGSATVSGMAENGVAVGTLTAGGTTKAVRWASHGQAEPLPGATTAPASQASSVTPAIGENGVIAYTTSSPDGTRPAVLNGAEPRTDDRLAPGRVLGVSAGGQVLVQQMGSLASWDPSQNQISSVELGRPTGWTAKVTRGRGLDHLAGQVRDDASGSSAHAAIWNQGRLQVLPGLGGSAAIATDVNTSGVAVGTARGTDRKAHAMRWTISGSDATGDELGTLGGATSQAASVNDDGWAAGWATTSDGVEHAAVWLADGDVVDLGQSLGAGMRSRAAGICGGRVFGTEIAADGTTTPVVWTLKQS